MAFHLVERDKTRSRVKVANMILLLAGLLLGCILVPATVCWFAIGDAESVQKSILAGSVVAAVVFGVILGRALSQPKRPLKFRQRHHRHSLN